MKKKEITHKDRVLQYIKDYGSITSLDAIREFGNTRLSASIWLLRHEDNINIDTIFETNKNRYGEPVSYARYYIIGSEFEKQLIREGRLHEYTED